MIYGINSIYPNPYKAKVYHENERYSKLNRLSWIYTYEDHHFILKLPSTTNVNITLTISEEGGGSGQETYSYNEFTRTLIIPPGNTYGVITIVTVEDWKDGHDWFVGNRQVKKITYPVGYN